MRREHKRLTMERDILKQRPHSSRRRASEVCFHRGEGCGLPRQHDVPPSGRHQERLLRLAEPPKARASKTRCAPRSHRRCRASAESADSARCQKYRARNG
jgi:hypothetical protein